MSKLWRFCFLQTKVSHCAVHFTTLMQLIYMHAIHAMGSRLVLIMFAEFFLIGGMFFCAQTLTLSIFCVRCCRKASGARHQPSTPEKAEATPTQKRRRTHRASRRSRARPRPARRRRRCRNWTAHHCWALQSPRTQTAKMLGKSRASTEDVTLAGYGRMNIHCCT